VTTEDGIAAIPHFISPAVSQQAQGLQ